MRSELVRILDDMLELSKDNPEDQEKLFDFSGKLDVIAEEALMGEKLTVVDDQVLDNIFELLDKYSDKKHVAAEFYKKTPLHELMRSLCRILDVAMLQQANDLQIEKDNSSIPMYLSDSLSKEQGENYKETLNKLIKKIDRNRNSGVVDWRMRYYLEYCQGILAVLTNQETLQTLKNFLSAVITKDYREILNVITGLHFYPNSVINTWLIRVNALDVGGDREKLHCLQGLMGKIRGTEHFPTVYAMQEALFEILANTQDEAMQSQIIGNVLQNRTQEKEFLTLHYFSGEAAGRRRKEDCYPFEKVSSVYRYGVNFSYRFVHGLADITANARHLHPLPREQFNHIIDYMRTPHEPKAFTQLDKEWLDEHLDMIKPLAPVAEEKWRPVSLPKDDISPSPNPKKESLVKPLVERYSIFTAHRDDVTRKMEGGRQHCEVEKELKRTSQKSAHQDAPPSSLEY